MTSSEKQKRTVLIAGIIALVIFSAYSVLQNISFETEWRYESYNNGYRILSYTQAFNDNTTEIIVPDKYEGKDVVALDDKVFYQNKKIKKVIIPDTVTELGASVFKECKNLETVELGDNVLTIGGECFKDCTSLTQIVLPKGITEIRGEAFMGCTSLKSVELPEKITEIKGNTFENCKSLESIYIPTGVTRIAAHAFYGCSALSKVFIPDTVTEIGSSAFRLCDNLKSVELPENVTVNERAFKESPTKLTTKVISDAMMLDIEKEIQGKNNYDALYVVYEEAKGSEEILINQGMVCVVDSIKFNEIIKEGYALREFKNVSDLVTYLNEAKQKGAQHIKIEFHTEIGSEKVGAPYFVEAFEYIDNFIATLNTSETSVATPEISSITAAESIGD